MLSPPKEVREAAYEPCARDGTTGKWGNRSLRNNKVLNTPFGNLSFGEGVIDFTTIADHQILDSSLDTGGGYVLNLQGEVVRERGPSVPSGGATPALPEPAT